MTINSDIQILILNDEPSDSDHKLTDGQKLKIFESIWNTGLLQELSEMEKLLNYQDCLCCSEAYQILQKCKIN